MKIPELAKKLGISPSELRTHAAGLGYDLGQKSRTIKDSIALKLEPELRELLKNRAVLREAESISKVVASASPETITLPEIVTVRELASTINKPVSLVIKELLKSGILASINENIDFITAQIVADQLGVTIAQAKQTSEPHGKLPDLLNRDLKPRPPVVVVMGHVDHGKTSLLDRIRKTAVVSSESGGITQHIGAYQAKTKTSEKVERLVTFIDTPGHSAFTAMRAHGAKITDIAVLVVAADDGVKPQTIEAIQHANAAGVPIIVAINKIDLPGANVDRVKKSLAEYDLNPEEWGGSTPIVEVSAKTGQGIEDLLEVILLQSDIEELKAPFTGLAGGVVIESHLDPKSGPVASLLVQSGILSDKDIIVAGTAMGKIKRMTGPAGVRVAAAKPSDPVRILGFGDVPSFGERFQAFDDEKTAKQEVIKNQGLGQNKGKASGSDLFKVSESVKSGQVQELNIVIKADFAGSLEAIKGVLSDIGDESIGIKVVGASLGNISESDIALAEASNAIVVGFKVQASPSAKNIAKDLGIEIHIYEVIYDLIDEVKAALSGILEAEEVEIVSAEAKILKVFNWKKKNKIIGIKVSSGVIEPGQLFYEKLEGERTGTGKVISVRMGKEAVRQVEAGNECGVGVEYDKEPNVGSRLVFYSVEKRTRKI